MKFVNAFTCGWLLAGSLLCGSAFAADVNVGFISALSGPNAGYGITLLKGAKAAISVVSKVNGRTLNLISLDDGSETTLDTRDARKLVSENKVDILVGGSSVAGNLAIAAVGYETETPLIATSPIRLPEGQRGWTITVTAPASMMLKAVVDEMKKSGVHTVGYIGFADAWGDLAYAELLKYAADANIKIVANERYARTDVSVTGQVLRVMSKHPDAIITGTAGSAGAIAYRTLAERGYRGKIYGTHGIVNSDFLRLAGKSVEGLIVPAPPGLVAEQLPADNPIRKSVMDFRAHYQAVNGEAARDAFASIPWDVWQLIVNAISRIPVGIEPGTHAFRVALRDALATSHEVVGSSGIYNFKPGDVYGVDERARVIVTVKNGAWKLLH